MATATQLQIADEPSPLLTPTLEGTAHAKSPAAQRSYGPDVRTARQRCAGSTVAGCRDTGIWVTGCLGRHWRPRTLRHARFQARRQNGPRARQRFQAGEMGSRTLASQLGGLSLAAKENISPTAKVRACAHIFFPRACAAARNLTLAEMRARPTPCALHPRAATGAGRRRRAAREGRRAAGERNV